MKKLSIIGLLLCCAIFLIVSASYGAEDTDKVLNELQSELQNKGMPAADIAEIKKPIKEILEKGATKDELKRKALRNNQKEEAGVCIGARRSLV